MAETTRVGATVRGLHVKAETGKLVKEVVVTATWDHAAASQRTASDEQAQADRLRRSQTAVLQAAATGSAKAVKAQPAEREEKSSPVSDTGLVSRDPTTSATKHK